MQYDPMAEEENAPLSHVGSDATECYPLEREVPLHVDPYSSPELVFLSVVSHEFRTPLTSVLGYAELLNDGVMGELTSEQQRVVARIVLSSRHMTNLINQVLEFTRLATQKTEIQLEPVNVREFVDDLIGLVSPTIAEHDDIHFSLATLPPHEIIQTDVSLLRQILINLLTNAVRFTPSGTVTFATQLTVKTVMFSVQDTGIGMSEQDVVRATNPFWQKREPGCIQQGLGLGLAVVQHAVELLGGKLRLESEIGIGTTATVTFSRFRFP